MNSEDVHDIAAQEWIGRTIDTYQIMLEIGQGCHGVLFLGEEATTHESVAVKILYPGHTADVALSNARVLRAFHHEGLAAVHACGKAHGFVYIISEYIQYKSGCETRAGTDEGVFSKNLLQYVQMRADLLTEKESADIMSRILDALQYVHGVKDNESTLPHGSVHPNNILLQKRADGTVKVYLTDIGLPCDRLGENDMDAYISPEELQGQIATQQSDIYSLGAMIHLLLAGSAPGTPLVMPTDIRTDIAAGWNTIIQRCLAYEPLERFPDYQALRADILTVKKLMPKRLTFSAIRYAIGAFIIIGLVSLATILALNMREGRSPVGIIKQIWQQNSENKSENSFSDTAEAERASKNSENPALVVDELSEPHSVVELSPDIENVGTSTAAETDILLSPNGATTVDTAVASSEAGEGSDTAEATTEATDEAETPVSDSNAGNETVKPVREYDEYTVRKNDTYYSLARTCGISVQELLSINNLTVSNVLLSGTKMRVPAGTQFPPEKEKIATEVNETTGTVSTVREGVALQSTNKERGSTTYKVKKGDTYFSLSQRYKISIAKLQEMNANKPLKSGMTLKVPVLDTDTNATLGESHNGAE